MGEVVVFTILSRSDPVEGTQEMKCFYEFLLLFLNVLWTKGVVYQDKMHSFKYATKIAL